MLYHTGDAIGGRTAAIRWLREAAEHGLPRAQAMLAELFAEEPEEGCNRVEACFWFLVAEKGLSGIYRARAEAGYARIAIGLTPSDLIAVTGLAERWKPAEMQEDAAPLPARARRSHARNGLF